MRKLLSLILSTIAITAMAQNPNPIRVNQVGYYPNTEKTAAIEESGFAKKYTITDANGKKVWTGKAVRRSTSPWSGKAREIIDFSQITTPGQYTINAGKNKQTITITGNAYSELAKASMKAFYLQRMSEPILTEYAGVYSRPAGHMDNQVMIHESAATDKRPAGTIIQCPGGWYDAGDYNKYIVNSGFSVSIMLYAYIMNKEYFDKMNLNIPESGNSIPDYLDEIMVNLKWMQTMQDPDDGGVYHKLTTPNFEAFIMPTECKQQRYVVEKTTAASLDFAATMALASRIYSTYPEYKQWAKEALAQAKKAYKWAQQNPRLYYRQNDMNEKFKPAITTGAYDDENVDDEFFWAEIEIALCGGRDEVMNTLYDSSEELLSPMGIPTWGYVKAFTLYAVISEIERQNMLDQLMNMAGEYVEPIMKAYVGNSLSTVSTSCFQSPYGNKESDFGWGCLAEGCCGQGIALLYAYRMTHKKEYLKAAMQLADYLLGRNATGYCYVTGFGTFSPKNPHQRLSHADGIAEPLPGFLVGGPNPGQQDKATCPDYPSNYADESYTDNMNSYASNEIAINWNASLAAFIGWLDAELSK